MAIKRKDGSKYRLQGPNPIMKEQNPWVEDSKIHNFNFPEITTKEGMIEEEEYETFTPTEIPQRVEPKEEIVTVTETTKEKPQRIVPKGVKRNQVWILPATITEFKDPLYGETRSSINYGNKINGEVVIMSSNDLSVTVWTNGVKVERGSIIYICEERRWWKVQQASEKSDGFLYICTISDFQPAFE